VEQKLERVEHSIPARRGQGHAGSGHIWAELTPAFRPNEFDGRFCYPADMTALTSLVVAPPSDDTLLTRKNWRPAGSARSHI